MKLRTLLYAACVVLACRPLQGQAQNLTGTMGGVNFNLATPQGYCVPQGATGGERVFSEYIKKAMENSGSTVMRIVADCSELQARRADSGSPIFDYVVYYFPHASEKATLSGDRQANRKTECNDLRSQTDAAIKDVPEISERTAREMKLQTSVKNIQYLGVLDEDSHGCYAALLSRNVDGKGKVFVVYVIVLRTVIHGKDLWVGVYSQYGDGAANVRTLERAKTLAAQLDEKNPD